MARWQAATAAAAASVAAAVATALLMSAALPSGAAAARTAPVGLHFDIEPQALQDWNSPNVSQSAIIDGLVDLLVKLNSRWNVNSRPGKFVWDMPNWYDSYSLTRGGQTKTYAEWVIGSGIDRVNIMNFVDSYAMQVSRMTEEVKLAEKMNVQVSAAVETQNLSFSSVSFFEEGKEYLQNVLVDADKTFRQMAPSVWQEYTIHDYEALRGLPSSGPGYQFKSDRVPMCIYVWQWWLAFSNYTTERQQMWSFLASQPYQINSLLFESEALLRADQQTLQAFIDEAASKGFKTEMAIGFSKWVLPQFHNYVEEVMQLAANFIRYGPSGDPMNPPTDAPPFPTNSPAPTVIKTDIPWVTDRPTGMPTTAPTNPNGGTNPPTNAPTSPPDNNGGGGGRVPTFQSAAPVLHAQPVVTGLLALAAGAAMPLFLL